MTEEAVVQMISEAEDFPRLSETATEIARMTSDLSAPVKDVSNRVKSDPSLLERMVKVVNAPFYGLSGTVTEVADAISLIGYKQVCSLAVGISVMDLFPSKAEGGFDYKGFWERAICSGVAAGAVGARVPGELSTDVFSAGLLQDIGVLFLVRHRPLEYGTALGVSTSKGVHIAVAERETWGGDHALVGSMLCKHWRLPGLMTEMIRHHHFSEFGDPVPEGTKTIIQVLNLSNLITDVLFDRDDDERREVLDARGKAFFRFGPKLIDDLLAKIPVQAKEVGEAFSIEVEAGDAPAAAEVSMENFLDTCPKCKAAEQTGKFCSECGGPLLKKEAPAPERISNKVLIAEDSIASRRALCFVVKKLGYIPVEATNGYEAVELSKRDPPGMVMLDVMMPNMNGLEALKRIRQEKLTANIPVVMLTSLTDSETVVEAVQLGANDYVVKPYTADVIADRVTKYGSPGGQ